MEKEGKVILLNKPFLGGWLNAKGHIGHEIIDFLQTDDGEYYVYNNHIGSCPNDIWIEGTTGLKRSREEKYVGKYLVLTSEKRGDDFDILYVIELAEKLHRYGAPTKNKILLRKNQAEVKKIIRERNIKYNGKYLDEIYTDDDSLLVTFKGAKIYKAIKPIVFLETEHNFQRNRGYLYNDREPEDYNRMLKTIEAAIENGKLLDKGQIPDGDILQEFTPRSVSKDQIGQLNANTTFINLIQQEDNEQIFTNILYNILEQGELLKHFCERFRGDKNFSSEEAFIVLRETKVVDGRMDVCAESENQRVIIENKINSGLNGVRPADNTSQLSVYHRWGSKKKKEPLCFVVAPNYRCSEIKREICEKDPDMKDIYQVKTYGDIADFIEDEMKAGNIPQSYAYYFLLPQIVDAFRNLAYTTKEDLYAKMFLSATNS